MTTCQAAPARCTYRHAPVFDRLCAPGDIPRRVMLTHAAIAYGSTLDAIGQAVATAVILATLAARCQSAPVGADLCAPLT